MKIHTIFTFQNGPYGGGNQFLKALRAEFEKNNNYTSNPDEADVFLFNSFQNIEDVLKIKKRYPQKLFVHRVDGPISLYRNSKSHLIDKVIYQLNDKIADATIFQSEFSQEANQALGISKNKFEHIIYNAPDNKIFFQGSGKILSLNNRKIRLISISWSSNPMKGFDVYKYLDDNLDFLKYDYMFVGNSPIQFKNIRVVPPTTSEEVAVLLRESDIYITASQKDPCSNSLIEALCCGIPAIALNDGGHPELIGKGGEVFKQKEEVGNLIEKIKNNYTSYVDAIPQFSISEIGKQYLDIINKIYALQQDNQYIPKNISFIDMLCIKIKMLASRFIK